MLDLLSTLSLLIWEDTLIVFLRRSWMHGCRWLKTQKSFLKRVAGEAMWRAGNESSQHLQNCLSLFPGCDSKLDPITGEEIKKWYFCPGLYSWKVNSGKFSEMLIAFPLFKQIIKLLDSLIRWEYSSEFDPGGVGSFFQRLLKTTLP